MQIHEIIRTRRTALGLTQEQLAGKLGVSAPAVNKWERGNSYPDITLLPVLARTLRVDLNTLLSFREDLTETEIAEFLNRLYEVSRTEGCGAAFSLAEEKLRQFPNSDALAYSAAGLLEGLLTLFPGTDETARPGREDFVAGLYEQAAQSADPKIREWATYTVASRCIARGDLDRAEALLDQISNTHRDKRELLSALRRKQGRTEEAWTLLERELFDRAHGIQTTLLSLIEMAQAEGDRQRAQGFCDAARRAGEALDLSDYAVLSAPFQLAAAEQDGPLTPEELAACEAIRAGLSGNFCRRCGYCAPCTVGIDIPGIFTLENYLKHYDLADWARSRYESQTARAGDCIGCGKCEARCPYELPIREKLKGVAKAFGA